MLTQRWMPAAKNAAPANAASRSPLTRRANK
jgi:hypothetical protein